MLVQSTPEALPNKQLVHYLLNHLTDDVWECTVQHES